MQEAIEGVIYKYTSPNGKCYIGQTICEKRRRSDHRLAAKNSPFHNAVQKHGYANFTYELLHTGITTMDELNALEEQEISSQGTLVPNGYNLDSGGRSSLKHESTKEKIRQKAIGRKISEETRQKLRDSHTGYKHTNEAKEKLSKTLTGRDKGQGFRDKMKEIRNRPEMKEAVRKAQTGRKRTGEALDNLRNGHSTQKILCITTGVVYNSIKEASIDTGVNRNSIANSAKGKVVGRKYRWAYV